MPNPLRLSHISQSIAAELGLHSLYNSPVDTKLLIASRFVRLFAYGATTLILALYLSSLGISDTRIGLFMTLTLLGDVVISFVLTLVADAVGRRRILILGAGMMAGSGVVFGVTGKYWVLVVASVVGVISPSGNEIGPFKAIEESTLAQLTPSTIRNDILAWYILFGTVGTAIGMILCGWVVERLQRDGGWSNTRSYRLVFFGYAVLGAIELLLAILLSRKCETPPKEPQTHPSEDSANDETRPLLPSDPDSVQEGNGAASSPSNSKSNSRTFKQLMQSLLPPISPESRTLVFKLCLLFAVDSIASGLAPASWITYFFVRKFSLPEGTLGTIFFGTSLLASASNLAASSIARRIGLIKTMVFTHIPAAIALALIPLPTSLALALVFLIIRASTNSMDQAPRQAFLASAVLPGERTAVMGAVNVVKTLSQSVGPVLTGYLAQTGNFWVAFVVAGGLKIGYDVGMLAWFLGHKTREKGPEELERDEEVDGEGLHRNGGVREGSALDQGEEEEEEQNGLATAR